MKNMIKLGLLSTVLSVTLLADVNVQKLVEVISPMQTNIFLKLTDTETNEPIIEDVKFGKLSVDEGAKIDGVGVVSSGTYIFNILRTAGCNKSANSEVKGVFSTTIKGKKVKVPYSICKEDRTHFETAHPYKNNEKQEKVLSVKADKGFDLYLITIKGETEANYDFITFTDMSGKVLEARVRDYVTNKRETQKLKFSGKVNKRFYLNGPRSGLEVKVHFTSDGSVTKEGVKIDMRGHNL